MEGVYKQHLTLTNDVGATVSVENFMCERVMLSMGGDLSISISFSNEAAREFGEALLEAADKASF